MNIKKTILAMTVLAMMTAAGVTGAQGAADPQTTSGWFANRIVGAYASHAMVRVCGSPGPDFPVVNTIIFNQGGTVVAAPRFPPQGADGYSRTIDLGTWSYNPRTNRYSVSLHFYGFVNGEFQGTTHVERTLQMSADGNSVSGPVHTTTYAPDGSVILEQCGTATSTRQ
ncbi:MAG: hypothetical protein J0H27_00470 [Xanthomonadales bacterium]|nr:hypothetical protein [Xanthomonadales bacterium]ODU93931.1 MAG: hypothetical protein ABT18_06165 [Rhodanobacter sp. SCN 66-43]OJY82638.1 MAG: hypothetical protein BGP23_05775 [Xanthomonadales bacterium 66-474]